MCAKDSLLPLAEVTNRLKIVSQAYAGMREIPVERIVGSVDRSVDFDRFFRPRNRGDLKKRLDSLKVAFKDQAMPPISVYEASDLYFVSDGHHRVALARREGVDFLDAEVTALHLSSQLTPDVDVQQLIHTEQHRRFMERTQLLARHPEAKIEFSRPIGYGELLDIMEAHAYDLSRRRGELVPTDEASADWYATSWTPAQEAIAASGLPTRLWFKTLSDMYLWTFQKRRELRTVDRNADWTAAATARAHEPVQRAHFEIARRERRAPLPDSRSFS